MESHSSWGAYLTGRLPQLSDASYLPSAVSSVDDIMRSIATARATSEHATSFTASQCNMPVTDGCADGKRYFDGGSLPIGNYSGCGVMVEPSDHPGLSKRYRRS
jgi:hypothetical protein